MRQLPGGNCTTNEKEILQPKHSSSDFQERNRLDFGDGTPHSSTHYRKQKACEGIWSVCELGNLCLRSHQVNYSGDHTEAHVGLST